MSSFLIGLLTIVVGALFCFRGVVAMRVVIAIWGAFVGFYFGAGLVSAVSGDGLLATPLGWIVGLLAGAVFALLAYLYYAVGVTLAMASIGFVLGTTVIAALGATWNWVIVLVGVIAGVLLAVLAIVANLPAILLIVLSSLAGASAIVSGIMLITATIALGDLTRTTVTTTVGHNWWWYAIYVVLFFAGVVAQAKVVGRNDKLQQQW